MKKAEHQRIDGFEQWCWRRLLRVLWTARRSNQSILKEINPKYSALCIRWPKYWSFSFSISPSNEYLGLISFRIDWLDLLVVQGSLKSLLQHHNLKAPILQCSAFFMKAQSTSIVLQFKKSLMKFNTQILVHCDSRKSAKVNNLTAS